MTDKRSAEIDRLTREHIASEMKVPAAMVSTTTDLYKKVYDEMSAKVPDDFDPDKSDPFVIQPEQYGATVDIASFKEQILERAAEGSSGSLEFQTTPVAPKVTTQDVRATVTLRSSDAINITETSAQPLVTLSLVKI